MRYEQSGFDMDLFESRGEPIRLDWLREIVDRLPPREREVIECIFWQQLTIEATAEQVGCTTYMVKGALERGKRTIAKAMQKKKLLGAVPPEVLPGLSSLSVPLAVVDGGSHARPVLRAKDRGGKNCANRRVPVRGGDRDAAEWALSRRWPKARSVCDAGPSRNRVVK